MKTKFILAGIAAIGAIGIFAFLNPQSGAEGGDNWNSLVGNAERQNHAASFTKKYENKSVDFGVREEIIKKDNNEKLKLAKEAEILNGLSGGLKDYQERLRETLKNLANKELYRALLYNNQEAALKRLGEISKQNNLANDELQKILLTLRRYQKDCDKSIEIRYTGLIHHYNLYAQFSEQIKDYIRQIEGAKDDSEACIKLVNLLYPTLTAAYQTLPNATE